MALAALVTREALKQHLEALGLKTAARGLGLKSITHLFRLYWLVRQHNLVVEGLDHASAVRGTCPRRARNRSPGPEHGTAGDRGDPFR
ncbi:hypothetical protein [Myxococcus sp. AB036A]|uniref:hypothetical protein n=1 Tax=Myxococcus sp. AB036A TaxID=2562793 RepID=UPI001891C833|nr:hypothetical protein [Myxococcus sp. AB036A]